MRPREALSRAGASIRRARRLVRLRRVVLLASLFFLATSCVRPLPTGLQPPAPPTHAYLEREVALSGSAPGSPLEGYIVQPQGRGPFRCAVLLHGRGGWWRAYVRYGTELASRGIAALLINYHSAHYVDMEGLNSTFEERRQLFEAQNEDIYRATAEFARSPLCAGGRVGVVGFSLGADKAMRAAAALPEVGAVVAYYGPYDYVSFIRTRVNPVLLAIATEDLLRWKQYLEAQSPIRTAERTRAAVLLLHGVEDAVIPAQQSIRMMDALRRRRGGAARLKLYEGVGHNFILRRGPPEVRDDSIRLAVDFLRQSLPAEGPARIGERTPPPGPRGG